MQEMMLAFSESALADADVLLYVTDVIENPEKNMEFLEKVKKMQIPVLLLINKIDQSDPKKLGDIVENGTLCCLMQRFFLFQRRINSERICS